MVYFSELFRLEEKVLEDYGAINISLINDIPLFIDPFLLYASDKQEYKELHEGILDYLTFLRSKAAQGAVTMEKIKRWYCFHEVKQNWLGYSETGNGGSGLGVDFGRSMTNNICNVFNNLRNESITETSHLEKLCLFRSGVGRDNVSDFTCNLIKEYLLKYTETFARQYLQPEQCRNISVQKVTFDYKREVWRPRTFYLPFFNDDFVLLTPKDLLTKDENWINLSDMRHRFLDITASLPNEELRDQINDMYARAIPERASQKERNEAASAVINRYPMLMDYYIKLKEEDKEGARDASSNIVTEVDKIFIRNIQRLILKLQKDTTFYQEVSMGSYEATRKRVMFLKHIIEDCDGYKLFYNGVKPIKKEKDLQILFKFTWFGTAFDVNAEVNNGRGPVDYKVAFGSSDKTLVEFKLAKNSKLKQNLQHQVGVYEQANDTQQSMKVILYFSEAEYNTVVNILKELKLENSPNIILIDACNDKVSASNVKS
jgi:hypothetical protein